MSKVVLFEFYLDGLLIHPSVAPECTVVQCRFYFDGLLTQLLVETLEWSSVVCSSNEGIGSH